MPIEIKELHIKVTVSPPQDGNARQGRVATGPNERTHSPIDKDAVVAECLEQVLQILNNKKER